jgi:hypothetical protein
MELLIELTIFKGCQLIMCVKSEVGFTMGIPMKIMLK